MSQVKKIYCFQSNLRSSSAGQYDSGLQGGYSWELQGKKPNKLSVSGGGCQNEGGTS